MLQFPQDEPLLTTTGVPSVAVANGIRTYTWTTSGTVKLRFS